MVHQKWRGNPPSIRQIRQWWMEHYDGEWPQHPQRYDWDRYICWACEEDFSAPSKLPGRPYVVAGQNKLQRAHLEDAALGGSDNPENFVLLCRECHRTMPQGIFGLGCRAVVLIWVKSQPHWDEKLALAYSCLRRLDEQDIVTLATYFQHDTGEGY